MIEDPDESIYESIRHEILNQGESIIPILEAYWEEHPLDSLFQERAEILIHELQFRVIKRKLKLWVKEQQNDILKAFLIINQYQYPDSDQELIVDQLLAYSNELDLNLYENSSTRQKLEVLNHLFFNKWGFKGNKQNMLSPQNSFISEVLSTKKGNPLSLSLLYILLAQWSDISIVGVNMPRYFLVGAFDKDMDDFPDFFIDVFGKGYELSESELRSYLKKMNILPKSEYFLPCQNIEMVARCLNNLIHAYTNMGYEEKVEELEQLKSILTD